MDPELYANAKALFIELVEKSPKDRENALKGLEAEQPELARTVRDLLASHVSRTLFSGATGKASDTTTQSKSISTIGMRRISSNLVGGTLPILLAVAATLLLYGFSVYLHRELYKQTRDETKIGLESMAEQKAIGESNSSFNSASKASTRDSKKPTTGLKIEEIYFPPLRNMRRSSDFWTTWFEIAQRQREIKATRQKR